MSNNKQQMTVEMMWNEIDNLFPFKDSVEAQKFCAILDKYKEMEKEMTIKLYADYENYLEESFKNQCGGQAVILSFQEFYEQRYGGSEQ